MTSNRRELDHLLGFLVAYRVPLYLGALVAMSLPLGFAWLFAVELRPATRTTIVAVSFAVILLTYGAERRVGLDHTGPRTGESTDDYPLRMRISVLFAIAGTAAGVYFLLVSRPAVGLLFLVGAVLFLQQAYRSTAEVDREGT